MKSERQAEQHRRARVITLHEAAVILHASYSTVLRLATSGELPAFRLRNSWRTSDVGVEDFIEKSIQEQRIICKSVEV